MVRFAGGLLLFTAYATAYSPLRTDDSQQPIQASAQRKLQGRFLHITDLHPDPFYQAHTNPDGDHPCHGKPGKGDAGYFGAPKTECDTPFTLINATFDWIKENIKDDVDFVVWTGDSARHDNDERLPRNNRQIEELNQYVVDQFVRVFGKTGEINPKNPLDSFVIPIVPTYGNNDVLPHNIFTTGPNRWTRTFENIWRGFIPQEQKHSFARGGWYFSEVIPNRLAVFSLNSLYFFDSNSAVDGCDARSEPGYEHMNWLRIQLQFLRERGMKAILIGHVPPARTESKQNWDESCYQKYTLWLRQYRDVIVANLFGHMNVDHFMFQDVNDLKYKFEIDGIDTTERDLEESDDRQPLLGTLGAKKAYLSELHDSWADLPKPPKGASYTTSNASSIIENTRSKKGKKKKKKEKQIEKFYKQIGGPYGERFSLTVVSPSVVPNFFPTLRIYEYNITGLEHDHPASHAMGIPATISPDDFIDIETVEDSIEEINDPRHDLRRGEGEDMDIEKKKKKKKKKPKKPKEPDFPVPLPPSSTAPPGPAYSPQALSLIGWTQLYANLTDINAAYEKAAGHDKASKSQYVQYKLEYNTSHDKYYKMKDLTMMSWLHLAERIGREQLKHGDVESFPDADEVLDGPEGIEELEVSGAGDDVESEADVHDRTDEENASTKKKKKKGKKGKKNKKMKNDLWKEFLHRAYVHTMTDDELDEIFGT